MFPHSMEEFYGTCKKIEHMYKVKESIVVDDATYCYKS